MYVYVNLQIQLEFQLFFSLYRHKVDVVVAHLKSNRTTVCLLPGLMTALSAGVNSEEVVSASAACVPATAKQAELCKHLI